MRPADDTELPASPLTLPHTTMEKAALCDGLLPFLTGLREALWAGMAKRPDAMAGAEIMLMGRILLTDVRRLLRGEPMFHFVESLRIVDDTNGRFTLAVKLTAMEAGVEAFRKRYFGWHPALRRPAWYLCGDSAVDDARRLLPRDAMAPGLDAPDSNAEMDELRIKLVQRILRAQSQVRADAAPTPLHRPGAPETGKEIVLHDWPGVE